MKFFSIISFTVLAATLFLASGVEPAARPVRVPRVTAALRPREMPPLAWKPADLENGFTDLGAAFEGSHGTMDSIKKLEERREAIKQNHLATEFFGYDARHRSKTAGKEFDENNILTLEARQEAQLKQAAEYNKLLHKTQMLEKAAADAARKNNPKAAAAALEQARLAAQKLAANSKTKDQVEKTKGVLGKLRSAWSTLRRKMRKFGNKVTFGWIKYDKNKHGKKKPVADVAPAAGATAVAPVAAPAAAPASHQAMVVVADQLAAV